MIQIFIQMPQNFSSYVIATVLSSEVCKNAFYKICTVAKSFARVCGNTWKNMNKILFIVYCIGSKLFVKFTCTFRPSFIYNCVQATPEQEDRCSFNISQRCNLLLIFHVFIIIKFLPPTSSYHSSTFDLIRKDSVKHHGGTGST